MPAYICQGDLDHAWCIASRDALLDHSHDLYFLPEARTADLNARKMPPEFSEWARHKLTAPSRRKRYTAASAINGMSSWNGGDLFVSETAASKLSDHVGKECVFVPAAIDGAPQPYYLMWITNLVDALDLERSKITEVSWVEPDGTRLKRINDFAFHEELLKDRLLFRLPGHGYSEDCLKNLCTEAFVELVTKLKIDGFVFNSGQSGRNFVPVPVPRH